MSSLTVFAPPALSLKGTGIVFVASRGADIRGPSRRGAGVRQRKRTTKGQREPAAANGHRLVFRYQAIDGVKQSTEVLAPGDRRSIVIFFQKYFIRSAASSAVKG